MSYDDQDDTIGIIYRDSSESSKLKESNINTYYEGTQSRLYMDMNTEYNGLNTSELQSNNSKLDKFCSANLGGNYDREILHIDGYVDYTNIKENLDKSILNNLKESIKSNFKSIKREKEKIINRSYHENQLYTNLSNSQCSSQKSTIDSKGKTEKEKIQEYYKRLKTNSRVNTSNTNSFTKEREKFSFNKVEKEGCIMQENKIKINSIKEECNIINDNSVNIINEYVIYNSFKNIFKSNRMSNESQKSNKDYQCSEIISPNYSCKITLNQNNKTSIPTSKKSEVDLITSETNSQNVENFTNNFEALKLETSVLKDLDTFECNFDINTNSSNYKQSNDVYYKENTFDNKKIELDATNELNNHNAKRDSKCRRCNFYKNKLNYYKKSFQHFKKKYLKQKKSAEMLNLKLFYEMNKNSLNTDRLTSTDCSRSQKVNEENQQITKMLYDKLQGNLVLFEKLENEMVNKDILIKQQGEEIKNQKETINKLLSQFDILLNQGNFLINDILILKQSLLDKNIKDVDKEIGTIKETVNEYTNRIKQFTETSEKSHEKKHVVTDSNNKIEENVAENKENLEVEELSFDFSKSVIDTNKKSFIYDKSMRLLDLNNSQINYHEYMLTCRSNNSENNYNINEEKFNHDAESLEY